MTSTHMHYSLNLSCAMRMLEYAVVVLNNQLLSNIGDSISDVFGYCAACVYVFSHNQLFMTIASN